MKIKNLLAHLNTLNPEDEICVVWWERPNPEDINGYVSAFDWQLICGEFDDYIAYDGSGDLHEWMEQAITEYMTDEEK